MGDFNKGIFWGFFTIQAAAPHKNQAAFNVEVHHLQR